MKSSSMYAFVFGFFSLYINKVFEIHPCFAWINSLFPFIAEMYSIEWMYHDLLILSSADGHLGCFQLELLRKMLLWVLVRVFLWACAFASVGCKSGSGIAGACISCTFTLLEAAWLHFLMALLKEGGMGKVGSGSQEEKSFRILKHVIRSGITGTWYLAGYENACRGQEGLVNGPSSPAPFYYVGIETQCCWIFSS